MWLCKTEKEQDNRQEGGTIPLEKGAAGGCCVRRAAPPRGQAVANSICRSKKPQQILWAISMELGGK